jgi:aspartyl protease family protein
MRTYLLVVVAFGLFFSVLTHRPSSSPAMPVAPETESFSSKSSPQQDATGSSSSSNGETTELERSADGHFYADVEVNGTRLHMLVDTGASGIALSREDARAAGIATSIGMNDVVGEGADGSVHGEVVAVNEMTLGGRTARNVPAVVLNSGERSLLGQSFLANFESIEIHGSRMTLR